MITPLRFDDNALITDESGDSVADCYTVDFGRKDSVSHAAEIVRRVNLHDELVEALRKSMDDYDNITEGEFSGTSFYEPRNEFSRKARAILAKVDAAKEIAK